MSLSDELLPFRIAEASRTHAFVRQADNESDTLKTVAKILVSWGHNPYKLKLKPAASGKFLSAEECVSLLSGSAQGSSSTPASPNVAALNLPPSRTATPVSNGNINARRMAPLAGRRSPSASHLEFLPESKELAFSTLIISGIERPEAEEFQHVLLDILIQGKYNLKSPRFTLTTPANFWVVCVCSSDPRSRPALHPPLVNQFGMSFTLPLTLSMFLSRSPTPSPGPMDQPRHLELQMQMPFQKLSHNYDRDHEPPPIPDDVAMYTRDLITATRHHRDLDGLLITARCSKLFRRLVSYLLSLNLSDTYSDVESVKWVYRLLMPTRVSIRRYGDGPLDNIVPETVDPDLTVEEVLEAILRDV